VLHIVDSAKRAATLTQSLLAFSRKQVMVPRQVDLNDIIRRVERLLKRLIGEDIELITELSEGELLVLADAVQIEQVLMNLATNARDAMPAGGRFTLRSEQVSVDRHFGGADEVAPGSYALITVSDTGMGMDAHTREKIFEPFFTTKEMGQGTGLGLAIVYGIVNQHGGAINVSSEPDKGTVFKIYLPIASPVSAESRTPVDHGAVPHGTETILVAEDDQVLRQFTRTLLEEFGYSVIEALNGEDAVRQFREHAGRIRLVLLDTIMPRKNGKEAYKEIAAIMPGIKAIFMSGYTADIIDRKGLLEEGLDFIQKPMPPRELLTKIRQALDQPV
jgi:CheY-like chemotaxis protein